MYPASSSGSAGARHPIQGAGETGQIQLDTYPSDIFSRVEVADGRARSHDASRPATTGLEAHRSDRRRDGESLRADAVAAWLSGGFRVERLP